MRNLLQTRVRQDICRLSDRFRLRGLRLNKTFDLFQHSGTGDGKAGTVMVRIVEREHLAGVNLARIAESGSQRWVASFQLPHAP